MPILCPRLLLLTIAHLGLLCSSSSSTLRQMKVYGSSEAVVAMCLPGPATLAITDTQLSLPCQSSVSNHAATQVAGRLAIHWPSLGNKQTINSIKTKIKSSDSSVAISISAQQIQYRSVKCSNSILNYLKRGQHTKTLTLMHQRMVYSKFKSTLFSVV